jgi:hypothetical protein
LWRFLPLAVFLTCLAEMVLLPKRFFFESAMSILWSNTALRTPPSAGSTQAGGLFALWR